MKVWVWIGVLGAMLVVGILSIYVYPSCNRYGVWRKQSEARVNLLRLFEAERLYFAKYRSYTSNLSVLDWNPMTPLRYQYGFPPKLAPLVVSASYGFGETRARMSTPYLYGVQLHEQMFGVGVIEKENTGVAYVAGAIANLDNDEALDRMVITDKGRLLHLCDDVYVTWDDDPRCRHGLTEP